MSRRQLETVWDEVVCWIWVVMITGLVCYAVMEDGFGSGWEKREQRAREAAGQAIGGELVR